MNIETVSDAPRSQLAEVTSRMPPTAERLPLEPMDPQLTSIQPGGGPIYRLELAWGRLRRAYLKAFRPRYRMRMRQKRRGEFNGCPHEVLDPRDVKFFRNQGGYYWRPQDDPFAWRERLRFARVGLAELIVIGGRGAAVGPGPFFSGVPRAVSARGRRRVRFGGARAAPSWAGSRSGFSAIRAARCRSERG